jgi:hypothetical protein
MAFAKPQGVLEQTGVDVNGLPVCLLGLEGRVVELNSTATRIWRLLLEGKSLLGAAKDISVEAKVPLYIGLDEAVQAVRELLRQGFLSNAEDGSGMHRDATAV